MTRAVVFDLDGTLANSRQAIIATAGHAFAAHGLEAPAAEAVAALIGLPLPEMMARLLPPDAAALEPRVTQAYRDGYVAIAASTEQLFDGALELLDRLADDGHALAIATGKSQHGADASTRRHGIYERFATVRGITSVPRGKPHPDLLLAVLDDLGVPADRALMVGDTTYDLDMAHAAGVAACGVSWGVHDTDRLAARNPRYFATDMDGIYAAVRRHLA